VDDAGAGARVHKEVEWLGGLGKGGFDPEQTFAEFKWYFGGDILGGLGVKKSSSASGYGPKVTKHANANAWVVPSGLSSEMLLTSLEILLLPDQ
jgi:hypothetical protein